MSSKSGCNHVESGNLTISHLRHCALIGIVLVCRHAKLYSANFCMAFGPGPGRGQAPELKFWPTCAHAKDYFAQMYTCVMHWVVILKSAILEVGDDSKVVIQSATHQLSR